VEMMKSDAWKNDEFKEYNFEAKGADQTLGALHPLMKVRKDKDIYSLRVIICP
jgi:phenylalanyl-tRNA synthetase alpha chain